MSGEQAMGGRVPRWPSHCYQIGAIYSLDHLSWLLRSLLRSVESTSALSCRKNAEYSCAGLNKLEFAAIAAAGGGTQRGPHPGMGAEGSASD